MKRNERLFVYGTLQRGHLMHGLLEPLGKYLGDAKVHGRLYDLGGYPGLILDGQGKAVQGELYLLDRPGRAFKILDAYEGCYGGGAVGSEYRRVRCTVITDGRVVDGVWIYEYARPVTGLPLLEEGVYPRPKATRLVRDGLRRR